MTVPLPRLLTSSDLPLVELQAARLDGHVFAVAGAWCSVADLDSPEIRAAALASELGGHVIAAGTTAAWIWGGRGPAPSVHQAVVSISSRHRSVGATVQVREVVIASDEIVVLAGVRTTSPVRTVVDLARSSDWTAADRAAAHDIASRHLVSLDEAVGLMDRLRRVPFRVRALARLTEILG